MENPLKKTLVEDCIARALKFTSDTSPEYRRAEEQGNNVSCLLGVEGHLDAAKASGVNAEIAKVIKDHNYHKPGPSVIKMIATKLEELDVLIKK